ncbi:hypothetical protein T492DRAFT_917867 [Pavlovales sp. CCMP2436]|nr:hypothetical protein T492DRAFT_917867 [Pavlovales sp. CCMP2436]
MSVQGSFSTSRPTSVSTGVSKRTGGGYNMPPHVFKTDPAVLDIFDTTRRSAAKVPYRHDRNDEHYTADALVKREQLRTNPGLIDAARRFAHSCYALNAGGLLTKDEYFRVHASLVRILLGSEVSEAELATILHDDWEADAKGADALDLERLFASIFELADIWCPGISATQYLSFIDTLAFKLSRGDGQRPPSAQLMQQ